MDVERVPGGVVNRDGKPVTLIRGPQIRGVGKVTERVNDHAAKRRRLSDPVGQHAVVIVDGVEAPAHHTIGTWF